MNRTVFKLRAELKCLRDKKWKFIMATLTALMESKGARISEKLRARKFRTEAYLFCDERVTYFLCAGFCILFRTPLANDFNQDGRISFPGLYPSSYDTLFGGPNSKLSCSCQKRERNDGRWNERSGLLRIDG